MFTQESESRPWCQLGAGQVIAKIRVRAKSKKRFKLSLFRFHYSAWFLYFIRFQACYVACHPKASISFKLQWLFKLKKNWKAQLLGGKIGLDETLSPGFFPEVMRGAVDKGKTPEDEFGLNDQFLHLLSFSAQPFWGTITNSWSAEVVKNLFSLLTSHKIENTRRSAGDGGFAIHWIPGGCMAVERRVRLSS